MMKKNLLISGLVATAAVFGFAQEASAILTVNKTQTSNTIVQTASTGTQTPFFSDTATFEKFDTSLGTLDSVFLELQFDVTDGGTVSLDNESTTSTTTDVTQDATADINIIGSEVANVDSGFAPIIDQLDINTVSQSGVNLGEDDGDDPNLVNSGGSDFASFTGGTGSTSVSGTVASGGATDTYKANSDTEFDIEVILNQALALSAPSGISQGTSPIQDSATLEITYNFTPTNDPQAVPFEAESGMALVAVAGLVAYRKFRKRGQNQIDA